METVILLWISNHFTHVFPKIGDQVLVRGHASQKAAGTIHLVAG